MRAALKFGTATFLIAVLGGCTPDFGTQPVITTYEAHSAELFRDAADHGDTSGMVNLGFMYERGQGGLPRDESEAAVLYRKGAELGDARAMTNLAVLYAGGRGVPQDDRIAVVWLKKAARKDYEPAKRYLAALLVAGRGGLTADDLDAYASLLFEAAKGEIWAKQAAAERAPRGEAK